MSKIIDQKINKAVNIKLYNCEALVPKFYHVDDRKKILREIIKGMSKDSKYWYI